MPAIKIQYHAQSAIRVLPKTQGLGKQIILNSIFQYYFNIFLIILK